MRIGGGRIEQAVVSALLAALTPAGVKAALRAAEMLEGDHDAALKQWRLRSSERTTGGPGGAALPPGRARAPVGRPRPRARLGDALTEFAKAEPSLRCASTTPTGADSPRNANSC